MWVNVPGRIPNVSFASMIPSLDRFSGLEIEVRFESSFILSK